MTQSQPNIVTHPAETDSAELANAPKAWRCHYCGSEINYAVPSPSLEAMREDKPDKLANLVSRFATALLDKLRSARMKGRWGWDLDDWMDACQSGLLKHVAKGDPLDVAAYAAFCWHHNWPTSSSPVDEDTLLMKFQTIVGATSDEQRDAFLAGVRAALSPQIASAGGGDPAQSRTEPINLTDEVVNAALSEYWDLSDRGWPETQRVAMRKAILTALGVSLSSAEGK